MKYLIIAATFVAARQPAFAQRTDASLATAIRAIRAIDNLCPCPPIDGM